MTRAARAAEAKSIEKAAAKAAEQKAKRLAKEQKKVDGTDHPLQPLQHQTASALPRTLMILAILWSLNKVESSLLCYA